MDTVGRVHAADFGLWGRCGRALTAISPRRSGVTRREDEVLGAVVARLSNAEIAAKLFISERTVESHVSSLLRKLGGSDRVDLVERVRALTADEAADPSRTGRRRGAARALPCRSARIAAVMTTPAASSPQLGRCRILTIIGPGGVGKSRLTRHVAHHVADDYDDGVLWVELDPLRDARGGPECRRRNAPPDRPVRRERHQTRRRCARGPPPTRGAGQLRARRRRRCRTRAVRLGGGARRRRDVDQPGTAARRRRARRRPRSALGRGRRRAVRRPGCGADVDDRSRLAIRWWPTSSPGSIASPWRSSSGRRGWRHSASRVCATRCASHSTSSTAAGATAAPASARC